MPGTVLKAGGDPAKLNPDLENERKTCAFDVEELARWWNGGEQKLLEKRERGEHSRGDRNRVRVQVCVLWWYLVIAIARVRRALTTTMTNIMHACTRSPAGKLVVLTPPELRLLARNDIRIA